MNRLHAFVHGSALRSVTLTLLTLVPLVGFVVLVQRGAGVVEIPHYVAPAGVDVKPVGPETPTTIDPTRIELAGVAGTTSIPVRITGKAKLSGLVVGSDGALAVGATVRIARLDGAMTKDLVVGDDGRYQLPDIAGGRYFVRAFLAPRQAQANPMVFLLADGENKQLDLELATFDGLRLTTALAPDPTVLDQPFQLALRLARQTVDLDGIVRATPVPGAAIDLSGLGTLEPLGPTSGVTNSAGQVSFDFTCRRGAPAQVQVLIDPPPNPDGSAATRASATAPITSCDPPPPSTTQPPSTTSSSSSGGATTSTSAPASSSSSTG